MINSENILKGFRVTEKAANLQVGNKYTFVVAESASAVAIGKAVEKTFNVKVESVNTMNVKGKGRAKRVGMNSGYQSDWKKAIVTLKKGDTIQIA